ncbi:MAG TPA: sigma-70 family RNA polymerase sigma factor, partial [Verrucomicrobiae bacterium]|nr:sigma-70 family RNA polymerase sigma factor [Verrucomicrobiae bacterium]
ETAEDLSHEIFMKLIEKIDTFDEARRVFVVWFWQMARRMLIDHYRKKQETPFSHFDTNEVETMAVGDPKSVTGSSFDDEFRYGALISFLKTLSDEEKELFEYRFAAEMSYAEIAHLTGKSEGALRVAALRIKEKIKREMQSQ